MVALMGVLVPMAHGRVETAHPSRTGMFANLPAWMSMVGASDKRTPSMTGVQTWSMVPPLGRVSLCDGPSTSLGVPRTRDACRLNEGNGVRGPEPLHLTLEIGMRAA